MAWFLWLAVCAVMVALQRHFIKVAVRVPQGREPETFTLRSWSALIAGLFVPVEGVFLAAVGHDHGAMFSKYLPVLAVVAASAYVLSAFRGYARAYWKVLFALIVIYAVTIALLWQSDFLYRLLAG